jgi:excisionase family DNA binding protein
VVVETKDIERIASTEEDMDSGDPLWSLERVAKYMDVSAHQVRRFYQNQGLNIVTLGPKLIRFRKSDVEAFIAAHHGQHKNVAQN